MLGFEMLMVLASATSTEPSAQFTIKKQDFECLIRNIETAPKKSKNVKVNFTKCPPDFVKGLISGGASRSGPVSAWKFKRSEISCIKNIGMNYSAIARPLPTQPDILNVDLRGCNKK